MSKEHFIDHSNNRSGQKKFPVPTEDLILLDKDLTLVDHSYTITDQRIYKTIEDVQNKGWVLGLSSDNSLDSLQETHSKLGLSGPIIAERGAVTHFAEHTQSEEQDFEIFRQTKESMSQFLISQGISVGEHAGRELSILLHEPGKPNSAKAFINISRRLSIGISFRAYDYEGKPAISDTLTNQLGKSLEPLYPNFVDLFIDLNPEYGLLILSRTSIDKRFGTRRYMDYHGYQQVGMVGNSLSDYIGEDIALHYAVGNSTEEFKEKADYVASSPITSGVIEILEMLGERTEK